MTSTKSVITSKVKREAGDGNIKRQMKGSMTNNEKQRKNIF